MSRSPLGPTLATSPPEVQPGQSSIRDRIAASHLIVGCRARSATSSASRFCRSQPGYPPERLLVAVIADTHLPRGRRQLPAQCVRLIGEADAVIHAGDLCTIAVLRDLEALGPPVHAVYGNVDEAPLRRFLPAELTLELEGSTIAVLHDAGPRRGRLERLCRRFPEADAVIFGHSHMPLHETAGDFQIFNPGSPTERRRSERCSMGLMRVDGRSIEFEHIGL